ncbi:helix-turn-helix domain-containing protein [Risungbinella massiliensis]|uniref:helix-turn-helix domain-containing protein n=1 Tax=Risungbinella massiliensis TaxID=1329796 RepID=UPI0005CC897E|nr:helix-turn-helix transcriptional regulator [Risungbinella massiliensis]
MDIDLKKLGEILRAKRKSKGLRLKNLEDDNISAATISSIERGLANTSIEKIRYYCKQLDFDLNSAKDVMQHGEKQDEELLVKLALIENTIHLVSADRALGQLREIDLSDTNHVKAQVFYLKGKIYYEKKQWAKARKNFLEAIKIVDQNRELLVNNIKPTALYELGRISFYEENNLKKALMYTEEGLNCFHEDGERSYIKYTLLISKISYLDHLNLKERSLRTLERMWMEIDQIENPEVLLNMYEIKASSLCKQMLYTEAKKCALHGINIARMSKMPERSMELLTTLGSVYVATGELDMAENCFLQSIELQKKVQRKHLLISTFTQLGLLNVQRQKWKEAEQWFNNAVKIGEKSSDVVRYVQALKTRGDCFVAQGKLPEAIKSYKTALDISEEHDLFDVAQEMIVKLMQSYEQTKSSDLNGLMERLYRITVELRSGGERYMRRVVEHEPPDS